MKAIFCPGFFSFCVWLEHSTAYWLPDLARRQESQRPQWETKPAKQWKRPCHWAVSALRLVPWGFFLPVFVNFPFVIHRLYHRWRRLVLRIRCHSILSDEKLAIFITWQWLRMSYILLLVTNLGLIRVEYVLMGLLTSDSWRLSRTNFDLTNRLIFFYNYEVITVSWFFGFDCVA